LFTFANAFEVSDKIKNFRTEKNFSEACHFEKGGEISMALLSQCEAWELGTGAQLIALERNAAF
jgi:hypothetical protein